MDVAGVVAVILIAAAVGSLLPLALLYRREFGSPFAGFKSHTRTIRVPVSREDADGLCHRALRATTGDSESDRTGSNSFECAGLQFELVDAAEGTAITIRGGAVGNSWMHLPTPGEVRVGQATAAPRARASRGIRFVEKGSSALLAAPLVPPETTSEGEAALACTWGPRE